MQAVGVPPSCGPALCAPEQHMHLPGNTRPARKARTAGGRCAAAAGRKRGAGPDHEDAGAGGVSCGGRGPGARHISSGLAWWLALLRYMYSGQQYTYGSRRRAAAIAYYRLHYRAL